MAIETHAGVFEGIGGFSLAAKRAGLKTTWACEVDPFRKGIIRKNFKSIAIHGNIVKLHNPPYVDVLTGGFPCQNISVAGQSTGWHGIIGPQSRLWYEYLRIITECRPRYIVIENSAQLRNKGLEVILYDLSKIGYNAQWECLRGTEFGYPHRRERLFIIAHPNEERWSKVWNVQICRPVADIFKGSPGQAVLPVPIERVHWAADRNSIRMHNGFSRGLDRQRIAAIGDAVIVTVAEYLFRCIIEFDKLITTNEPTANIILQQCA